MSIIDDPGLSAVETTGVLMVIKVIDVNINPTKPEANDGCAC